MAALFRLCVFVTIVLLSACVPQNEARQEAGLAPEPGSSIPAGSPGQGLEKIKTRPDATPTPTPTSAMDKHLDPTGF